MIVKYCDKCGKEIDCHTNIVNCKLPTYKIHARYIGCLTATKDIDLCISCQSKLDSIISNFMSSGEDKE